MCEKLLSGCRYLHFPGVYRHFKGGLYYASGIALHTETNEKMVVYQAMYGNRDNYVRPLDMFASKVDIVRYPDAHQEYRFEELSSPDDAVSVAVFGLEGR